MTAQQLIVTLEPKDAQREEGRRAAGNIHSV
jgi:hypothetical protein